MSTIKLHFEHSPTVADAHSSDPERVTIEFDSPEGSWVQLTYDSIRTQDGAIIAELNGDNCWTLVDPHGYRVDREQDFSDVIIEFVA